MNTFKIETRRQDIAKGEPNPQAPNPGQEHQEPTPAEKRFMKALHWMRCPKCGEALQTERHSALEIDVCPDCRTVCLGPTALEAIVAPENDFLRSCLRNLRRH